MKSSQDYVEDYLGYDEDGIWLRDTRFVFSGDNAEHCRIYQPLDDEEDDKYDLNGNDVDADLWDRFVEVFS